MSCDLAFVLTQTAVKVDKKKSSVTNEISQLVYLSLFQYANKIIEFCSSLINHH